MTEQNNKVIAVRIYERGAQIESWDTGLATTVARSVNLRSTFTSASTCRDLLHKTSKLNTFHLSFIVNPVSEEVMKNALRQ